MPKAEQAIPYNPDFVTRGEKFPYTKEISGGKVLKKISKAGIVIENKAENGENKDAREFKSREIDKYWQLLKDSTITSGQYTISDYLPYHKLENLGSMIVRRENPITLLEMLRTHKPMELKCNLSDGRKVNNCYKYCCGFDIRSCIEGALKGGMSSLHGVVAVVGFKQGKKVNFEQESSGLERFTADDYDRFVGRVGGSVNFEDINFIILRFPIASYPEEEMNEDELERLEEVKDGITAERGNYIFRTLMFEPKYH